MLAADVLVVKVVFWARIVPARARAVGTVNFMMTGLDAAIVIV